MWYDTPRLDTARLERLVSQWHLMPQSQAWLQIVVGGVTPDAVRADQGLSGTRFSCDSRSLLSHEQRVRVTFMWPVPEQSLMHDKLRVIVESLM